MPSFVEYEFMQHALFAWVLISLICPLLGIFLIVRRYTLISDTLAHSSLTGVIIGLMSGWSPVLTTLIYSMFSAFVIEKLRLTKKLTGDMVLALFLSLNMAFIAIALSLNSRAMLNIWAYLFWSVSLVTEQDLYILIWVFCIVVGVFFTQKKKLMLVTYDEEAARAGGFATQRIQMMFMLLVGMTIAVSFPIVWVLLLSSLLVLPVIAASQIARSFKSTLIIAEIISLVSVVVGIITSYYTDISASGIITLVLVWFFIVFFIGGILRKG